MGKKKYKTLQEKKEASIKNAKNYYQLHKDDPEFKEKRRNYYKGYYNNLSDVKKEAYRTYNSEYAFYVRSVITGKLEKKIIKNQNKMKELENKIHDMKRKLNYMHNKFDHLGKLNDDKSSK